MGFVGVISEYDPFHNGHQYHLREAKARSGCDQAVCIMSGSFTQRGAPALFSPFVRAKAAVYGGADLCLLLPVSHAVREAEHFALGGVYLLDKAGASHISFGCETDSPRMLTEAATLLEKQPPELQALIREKLACGLSHARAAGEALKELLRTDSDDLSSPNNILAIAYLRSLQRLGSRMIPVPVKRSGAYRASEVLPDAPSASALRLAMKQKDLAAFESGVPRSCLPLYLQEASRGLLCPEESMDSLLLYALSGMDAASLSRCPDCREGLENRILACVPHAASREELIALVKTRRYTHARISRILFHALLGTRQEQLPRFPEYTRPLACKRSAAPLLKEISSRLADSVQTVSRPARAVAPSYALELRADTLRALMCGQKAQTVFETHIPLTEAIE